MSELGLKGCGVGARTVRPQKCLSTDRRKFVFGLAGIAATAFLGGCNTAQTFNHGFTMPEDGLAQVPVGSSRDQVLIVLGTPQTTATLDNEVFYYISQRSEQTFAFSRPEIVEQRVVAVYFDETALVEQIADYGLQDGVIFDFASNTTPTGGRDLTFIGQILGGLGSVPQDLF
ncbi:MAG: outer membrane protein assembly factor BamE [Pseudomonadota bacterium]